MEDRITKVEIELHTKLGAYEPVLAALETEYHTELSLVCTGLHETADEDILAKAQGLIQEGLQLQVIVERALRMKSRNPNSRRPGIVKIQMKSKEDKLKVLCAKQKLRGNRDYPNVFLMSSQSHTERVAQHNFQMLLKEHPSGSTFRVTAHGKIVKKQYDASLRLQKPGDHTSPKYVDRRDDRAFQSPQTGPSYASRRDDRPYHSPMNSPSYYTGD